MRFSITHSESEDVMVLGQFAFYPDDDTVFAYFTSVDAYYPEEEIPIRQMRLADADRFSSLTELDSRYRINLESDAMVRFLDYLGGVELFLPEAIILENSRYQYPAGQQRFHGDQVLDFISRNHLVDRGSEHLQSVHKTFRMQTVLLNFLWQWKATIEPFEDEESQEFLLSLLDSNLGRDEMLALFDYMKRSRSLQIVMLELPLETERIRPNIPPRLRVNMDRATEFYGERQYDFLDNDSREFPVEVLNSTERAGLARRVSGLMQDDHLRVFDVGNYSIPLEKSMIIEWSGNTMNAGRLARISGREKSQIFFFRKPMDVEASLILGEDFRMRDLQF